MKNIILSTSFLLSSFFIAPNVCMAAYTVRTDVVSVNNGCYKLHSVVIDDNGYVVSQGYSYIGSCKTIANPSGEINGETFVDEGEVSLFHLLENDPDLYQAYVDERDEAMSGN